MDGGFPDLKALLSAPAKYATNHLGLVWWWSIGVIAAACLLGFLLGGIDLAKQREGKKQRVRRFLGTRFGPVEFTSAWSKFLADTERELVYGTCVLDDGTSLRGYVQWFNTDIAESADRDLVLGPGILLRYPGTQKEVSLGDRELVVISARQIRYLTIDRIARPALAEETTEE